MSDGEYHEASRVEPDGTVLCSDFSQEMVDAVADRVERLGVEEIETEHPYD